MKFAFYTLGCKVNQYETQAMEQKLLALGHSLGAFDEPCDCYIINTCTVTAVADKKNRGIIRRCRRQNPQAIVGVCGCYAQVQPQAVRELRNMGIRVVMLTWSRWMKPSGGAPSKFSPRVAWKPAPAPC